MINRKTCENYTATISRSEAFDALSEILGKDESWNPGFCKAIQDRLVYYSWMQAFSSSGGPFATRGQIVLNAMTKFRMEAWVYSDAPNIACIFCDGKILKCIESFNIQVKYE